MSPFDLRGPEFLEFYIVLGAIVFLALYISRRFAEPADRVKADFSDPYLIAFLRGGANELLRVSTISLIYRGLLKVDGSSISLASPNAAESVRNPLERELLSYFSTPAEAASVFSKLRSSPSLEYYRHSLETLGLLPNSWIRNNRLLALVLALVVLWGIAGIKIKVALDRGHTNIGFLIVLAFIFALIACKMAFPRLTLRGKATVKDLRVLFGELNHRSATSYTPNDVALLAALYGAAALPLAVFPYAGTLYPKATKEKGSWWGDSSSCGAGTSCGSSGGDGGGGGCGGGGCGGGCGGCGG